MPSEEKKTPWAMIRDILLSLCVGTTIASVIYVSTVGLGPHPYPPTSSKTFVVYTNGDDARFEPDINERTTKVVCDEIKVDMFGYLIGYSDGRKVVQFKPDDWDSYHELISAEDETFQIDLRE